jgi:hypothetical protein
VCHATSAGEWRRKYVSLNRRQTSAMRSLRDAVARELLARSLLHFDDVLVLIDRRFEPAAQRALGSLVEIVEQRRLPRIP